MTTIISFPRPILVDPAITADTFSTDAETFSFTLNLMPFVAVDGSIKTMKSFNVDFPDTGEQYTFAVEEGVNATTVAPTPGNPGYCTVTGFVPIPALRGAHRVSFSGQDSLTRPGGVFVGPVPDVILTSPATTVTLIAADPIQGYRAIPPAGINVLRQRDVCRVEWNTPDDEGLMGVRVVISTDPSGVNDPYVQYGGLVKVVNRVATEVIETATETTLSAYTKTTTITETQDKINISSIDIPRSYVGSDVFYVALSTVILDAATNHVYESEQIGPIQCGYVDLRKVNPSDFLAMQQQSDIAGRLISNITNLYPDLDLSPRTELRDLFVDPVAIELANSSVREWFARVSSSISALSQLDDADGDGISDPVADSVTKQILQRAFGLDESALQTLIDRQFDVLGEQAGIPRGGAEAAIVEETIYTTIRPTTRQEFLKGAQVGTATDDATPALTFTLLGSAVVDPANIDAYYNPQLNRWEVTLPAECDIAGSIGNSAGAGSIRRAISGIPTPWQVVNNFSADYGQDIETNIRYAARIQDRTIVGVDTGTRKGLLGIARSTPGVVEARVVASGDDEMLRDWIPYPGKHVYGCADVYVRGRSFSQNSEVKPYTYEGTGTQGFSATYVKLRVYNASALQLTVDAADLARITAPIIGVGEIYVDQGSGRQFYLGTKNATAFQAANGNYIITLDPSEPSYKLRTLDGRPIDNVGANGQSIPNSVAFGALSTNPTPALGFLRLASGISLVPSAQPVTRVFSITGESGTYENGTATDPSPVAFTGLLPSASYRIVQSSSPLLEGFSQRAGDTVVLDNSLELIQKTITFITDGPDTIVLDEGMDVSIGSDGKPVGLLTVVGQPQTGTSDVIGLTLYVAGVDYVVIKTGRYGVFSIKRTATSTIPLDREVVVTYNRYKLYERIVPVIDAEVTLVGTAPTVLPDSGILLDVWTPWSHGHTLLSDGSDQYFEPIPGARPIVPWGGRYIRVLVSDGVTKRLAVEGRDYILTNDAASGRVSLARASVTSSGSGSTSTTGSIIGDGDTVLVSYYRLESFTFTTQYPSYVATVSQRIQDVRHAAADILVKTMMGNAVDITMTIELDAAASPEIVDPKVRTVIGMVLDQASGRLSQAEVIRQIKAIRGVRSIVVPLTRFAKADGAYEVGSLIPAGTPWQLASTVPNWSTFGFSDHVFVTTNPVLQFPTLPSGGLPDASISLTYEGEMLKRARSMRDMAAYDSPTFYIIGTNDYFGSPSNPIEYKHYRKVIIAPKATITNPTGYPFRVTYQIFGEGGAQDLTLSPTEYVKPGKILIEYVYGNTVR
jgi:hypothetical protein